MMTQEQQDLCAKYSRKIASKVIELFKEKEGIDLDQFKDPEKAPIFFHALFNVSPALIHNLVSAEKLNNANEYLSLSIHLHEKYQ